jgi:hypothetical protein
MERIFELQLQTEADLREAFAHLRCELLKANREGRDLVLELWSDLRRTNGEMLVLQKGKDAG